MTAHPKRMCFPLACERPKTFSRIVSDKEKKVMREKKLKSEVLMQIN